MSVTFEKNNNSYSEAKCFNYACVKNTDTSGHMCDNNCQHSSNTGQCKNFKGESASFWEPKNDPHPTQYEVTEPFTIVDIFKKNPCHDEFLKLIEEQTHTVKKFRDFMSVEKSPVLARNLAWLKSNGFITHKKEEWVNVYITPGNETHTGNHVFETRSKAVNGSHLNDTDRYVGPVLKS